MTVQPGDIVRPKRAVNLRENHMRVEKVEDSGDLVCKFRGVLRTFRPDDVLLVAAQASVGAEERN